MNKNNLFGAKIHLNHWHYMCRKHVYYVFVSLIVCENKTSVFNSIYCILIFPNSNFSIVWFVYKNYIRIYNVFMFIN